jgi:hypothetical protein
MKPVKPFDDRRSKASRWIWRMGEAMRPTREENTNALVMKKLLVLGHLSLYN